MEDCRSCFKRLIARCPDLSGSLPESLISQDHGHFDDDAFAAIEELILKPSTTVVAAGCFRPFLPRLVSRMVQSSKRRDSISHHEDVCVAFSKMLDLAPHLLSSILQYFSFAPSPFQRLLEVREAAISVEVIRASYRFLHLEPETFRELWDWSPLLELPGLENLPFDVRWCAIQILSLALRMSDAATRDFSSVSNISEEDCFACLVRWEAFLQEVAVEKAGLFTAYVNLSALDVCDSGSELLANYRSVIKWKQLDGSKSHVSICGIDLPIRDSSIDSLQFHRSFVITPSVKGYLEAIALAVTQRQPLLLEGPIGSGKTSLIREVANLTGNSDALFIHLDDQMDTKSLLGSYVCTEIPGEFKWQPGTLTQAVIKGLWIIFEDIDKAPCELFSALVSLLEDRKLQVPGRGEEVYAAEECRLFATVTRTTGEGGAGSLSFSYLWRKVSVDSPTDEELSLIVKEKFPALSTMVSQLIGTLNIMRGISSESFPNLKPGRTGRQFSMRDLLKLCKRISSLAKERSTVDSIRDQIFLEAVDCFAMSISNLGDRLLYMKALGEQWNVPAESVEYYSNHYKPSCQELSKSYCIGRAVLHTLPRAGKPSYDRVFADTGHTTRLLERVARCIEFQEPVLLVGETGTGKTTIVQRLAWQMSVPLTVVNMSQQSDAADLLGGFKPVEAQTVCLPLLETFNELFAATFSLQRNKDFWTTVQHCASKRKWRQLLKSFRIAVAKTAKLTQSDGDPAERPSKRQRPISQALLDRWCAFAAELAKTEKQVEASKSAFVFYFVEGALVQALRRGSWILLDEINLAPPEILERLNGVFDGEGGSICLTERGDMETLERHPGFRIFGCMNPATDVGKQNLPVALRNRFTELYVEEMASKEDLEVLVNGYLQGAMPSPPVGDIVNFYQKSREEADRRLLDGAGHKPHYSLRSLSRALEYTRVAMPTYGFHRALYDGVSMSFLTLLDQSSSSAMEQLIKQVLFKSSELIGSFTRSPPQPSLNHVLFQQFWVEKGNDPPTEAKKRFCERYVLTATIRDHLKNLARAVFIRKYPVLLQGPTSSGKTSLVEYLAAQTDHKFVRINNHEHTDLQEYLGCYITDHTGKLVFEEGLLVQAVRNGYWVVLDELNLAPSEVLEALNRLLDDNRELFVPELQLTVKPHPHFMLFATQNPPGIYGGRKVLSRAFRNRFIELHVDDIPSDELVTILEKRCELPATHATKMVNVMKDLQLQRQGSKVFAGKHGFITPRDLFRWGDRQRKSGLYDDLPRNGYLLLAERIRNAKEKDTVQSTLETNMRLKLEPEQFYKLPDPAKSGSIVWTKSMTRLFSLVKECYDHQEPMLLVGETGCGKTTVCQLLAEMEGRKLHIINCHQHSETADFLGGFRPVRGRDNIALRYWKLMENLRALNCMQQAKDELSTNIENSEATLRAIAAVLTTNGTAVDIAAAASLDSELRQLHKEWQSVFTWQDGPLVTAMRNGDLVLVDEISLAEDSVLERLNSVLEPRGLLVLAEKGGSEVEELVAHPNFRIMATMNPGGDFGKKELSPALRNRFTEIWVPPIIDMEDLRSIVSERLVSQELSCLVEPLLSFWQWFQQHQEASKLLSVRDLLSWTSYINLAATEVGRYGALVHGAFLVLLNGLGLGSGISSEGAAELKRKCVDYLLEVIPEDGKTEALQACSVDANADHLDGADTRLASLALRD